MLGRNNAQFAIEFTTLIAFMFIIFLGFTAVITTKILDAKENERQQISENVAQLAKNEIELAQSVSDGYNRNFTLPVKINGNNYTISILDNREIVVNYLDKEYVTFLKGSIIGNLTAGKNSLRKNSGIVYVNT